MSKKAKYGKCECGEHLLSLPGYDDPNEGFAYNLRQCQGCGNLYRENVWENKGTVVLRRYENRAEIVPPLESRKD